MNIPPVQIETYKLKMNTKVVCSNTHLRTSWNDHFTGGVIFANLDTLKMGTIAFGPSQVISMAQAHLWATPPHTQGKGDTL
jgi:hypothetical protein